MRDIYIFIMKKPPNISKWNTFTIKKMVPWMSRMNYNVKKYYLEHFEKFCQSLEYKNPEEYAMNVIGKEKPILNTLWEKVKCGQLITFGTIRKIAHLNHWAKRYIDKHFDMILIDEAQDFDGIMLDILLKDTTLPKIFVGDPKQSIYGWRGCINAFERLPKSTLIIEFYSTFRIGNPACEKISNMFNDCWMISKSNSDTVIQYDH